MRGEKVENPMLPYGAGYPDGRVERLDRDEDGYDPEDELDERVEDGGA